MVNKILSGLDFCSEATMLKIGWSMGNPWFNLFCKSMLPAGKMIENAKEFRESDIIMLKKIV